MNTPVGRSRLIFRSRVDAGRELAERLASYAGSPDTVVVGLPRGGVPVAFEVAGALDLPLDVLSVRKLGVPENEELAMGAVASGEVIVLDEDIIRHLGISWGEVEREIEREWKELQRRDAAYRNNGGPIPVEGKNVIVVDDGAATGSTLLSAVRALRRRKAAKIIVALPVASSAAAHELRKTADNVVCILEPEPFIAVGRWYNDFSPTQTNEVVHLLREARDRRTSKAG